MLKSGATQPPDRVRIDPSLYGRPGIAFGGYVAGVLAGLVDGPSKVDFLAPTPLGAHLRVTQSAGRAELIHSDTVLARARAHTLELEPPRIPEWREGIAAVGEFMLDAPVLQPECFGCGYLRTPDGGLRIFPGLVPDRDLVAAAWRPSPSLTAQCQLKPEFAWASLDCPGAWARIRLANAPRRSVTAYLAAQLLRPVEVSRDHVVFGWLINRHRSKTIVGSGIASAEGELCAIAEALWIDSP